jgi:hypothetical protein
MDSAQPERPHDEHPSSAVKIEATFQPTPRPRFQFQLRTALIVMTALAILLSAVFAGLPGVAMTTAVLLATGIPMCLTIVLVYGRGYQRTFCIGALFPSGLILSWTAPLSLPYGLMIADSDDPQVALVLGIAILIGAVVIISFGLAAVGLRWLIERQDREAASSHRNTV